MTPHSAHAAILLPRASASGAAAATGRCWRAIVGTVRTLWARLTAADCGTIEREALAGLDERMLKDIGASHWLVADAAARAREDLHGRIDMGMG